ncbi:MobF family relaxase [Kitasatospora sp. NBC_01302]|uniref:MobF family relaxase n=1 Tax=Kitasatospora sp. NBC_01302 TaxID=2903575 RepID=UPI002E111A57|nr:relaxase domain-containing protein [Kitasatospora sp. NBC_01302]
MTLHPISAGSGIDYLMRTVASGDQEIKGKDLAGYWSSGGDTPGVWLGRQAEALGLSGQVTQQAADAIFKDGIDPTTGEALGLRWKTYPSADERYEAMVAREPHATEARLIELRKKADKLGQQTARAGWESVFSPVKSWSILWGVSNDEMRAQLEEAEQAAFEKVWARIEGEAAWTRVGPRGGQVQVEATGLIAAAFVHRTSRAGDPDYHRHVAISAKVQDAEGRWLALDARPLHRLTVALSETYTTELERQMWQRFGILAAPREDSIRPDRRPVREFLSISAPVVSLFSQRRRQTERELTKMLATFREREGREPSRAEQYALAQAAALTARPDKQPKSVGAERRQWRRRAWQAGIRFPGQWVKYAQAASREALAERPEPAALADVAAAVLATLESERETWTRANVEAETYRQLTAAGWHLAAGDRFDALVDQVTEHVLGPERCELQSPPETLTIPSRYLRPDGSPIFVQIGSARYTSHRITQWEADLVEAATRPAPVRVLTPEQIDAALAAGDAERGFTPTDEQRAVVHGVFARDVRATAIIGPAGTGKTTIMRLVREVADAHGIQVLGLAGGQLQADQLAEAAGIRAENIARWRTMSEQFARGQDRWTLRPDTIVIVDEAGQASTPDLHAILAQVENAGGRLLPVGDPRQLGSPGVGGALALLESDSQALHLSEVRRFRSANGDLRHWEIDAAGALARGDAEASWEAYSSRGRIQVGSLDEMLSAAYEAWQRDVSDGLTSILIAPTNALAAQLSERARADRVAAGIVDDRRTVTLADGNRVGAGDQIVTRANNRQIRCTDSRQWVRNGDVWLVREVRRDGTLVVEHAGTGNGAELPADYVTGGGVELGYAITKDRAQGVTVQTGHGLLVPGMDANSAYPTLTRGTYTNHAYLSNESQTIDPETGEPGRPLTGRQAWAAIVARDGTQLSATATQRKLWDEAEAIRTRIQPLRYVLDELAGVECREALARLIGRSLADILYDSPAWPALRAQLTRLANEGYDTDRLAQVAAHSRDWEGARDYAKCLHSRIAGLVEDQGERFRLPEGAERPATASAYEVESVAVGDDVLKAMGVRLPDKRSDEEDDRFAFAQQLAATIYERADRLAAQAQEDARAGEGWAANYGPEPAEVAEAVAWRDQLAAAAAYRDAADYTGGDATGPAPTEDDAPLRGLWRAAQKPADDATAYADALALAATGASWLDAVGAVPPAGDPARPAWVRAVVAVATYRQLWEYGNESAAIGEPPTEAVQRADYDHAKRALDAHRWVRRHPALGEADADTLAVVIARGAEGQAVADRAAAAIAAHDAAVRAQVTAEQAAEDAANRAAAAREQAAAEQPADRSQAAELAAAAERARVEAAQAAALAQAARAEAEATAPAALAAREDMRRAEEARRIVARRTLNPQPEQPGDDPEHGPRPWTLRPHGDLSDRELVTAANQATTTAVEIEKTADAEHAAQARETAAELREHAAELRAESRTRAVMDPAQRESEADERATRRGHRTAKRLDHLYADRTGPEALQTTLHRGKPTPSPAPTNAKPTTAGPQPAASRPHDQAAAEPVGRRRRQQHAEAGQPTKPARNRTSERLDNLYADRTGPDAVRDAKRRTPAARTDRAGAETAQPKPATTTAPTPATPAPKKSRRNAAARLDEMYDRDGRGPKDDPKNPGRDRKRRQPPPRRPGGPSI